MTGRCDDSLWFIGAESQADVDAIAADLTERGVSLHFETPRHRPEFAQRDA
ncbi:MAG: hypothetical protein LC793_25055 [Thermomicrobia bacterium]|nr:hypothetical protein [Thermomicrobia bacterium]MCA1723730.1 hypothetical protein [Thermomicrobia bacterium]